MIILIQVAIIIAAISLFLFVIAGRQTHAAKAWKKIALCLLAVAMVIAVLFPESTNVVANFVGVGRGADLLLYVLVIAFIVYAINNYIHQQRDRDALYRLARKVALIDAEKRYKIPKK